MLCRHCTTKCMDKGTDAEPVLIRCPACDGAGCDRCDHGDVKINGCPQDECASVVSAIRMFDLFEKGLPPISGGVLDQSACFIEAAQLFRSEEEAAKAERNGRVS